MAHRFVAGFSPVLIVVPERASPTDMESRLKHPHVSVLSVLLVKLGTKKKAVMQ